MDGQVQAVNQLLGAPDREGRDDHLAVPLHGLSDQMDKLLKAFRRIRLHRIAIRTFHHQQFGPVGQHRVAQEGHVAPADIPGEPHPVALAILLDIQHHRGRAEDVPRIHQAGTHARERCKAGIVVNRVKVRVNPLGILDGVQRLDSRLAVGAAFVQVRGIRFLDVARVAQHDIRQLGGSRGCIDWPAKAALHQVGQVAAVVDMGVGEHGCIDFCRVIAEGAVALVRFLARPLVHAAVNQQFFPVDAHEKLRPGDRLGGSMKLDLHKFPLFLK